MLLHAAARKALVGQHQSHPPGTPFQKAYCQSLILPISRLYSIRGTRKLTPKLNVLFFFSPVTSETVSSRNTNKSMHGTEQRHLSSLSLPIPCQLSMMAFTYSRWLIYFCSAQRSRCTPWMYSSYNPPPALPFFASRFHFLMCFSPLSRLSH